MKKIVTIILISVAMMFIVGCDINEKTIVEEVHGASYEYTITKVVTKSDAASYEYSVEGGTLQERRLHVQRFFARGTASTLEEARKMIDASLKRWHEQDSTRKAVPAKTNR